MTRKDGTIKHQVEISEDISYFILGSQENTIQVYNLSKRLTNTNFDANFSIQNSYSDTYHDVYVTSENILIFIDRNKQSVLFISFLKKLYKTTF
jgi:hypothetical protein